jgi:S1-C subfamily serine protease
LTVEQDENGNLIVARILAGSTIDKTKILHPGDVILEVNGTNVFSPEDLMQQVAESKTTIQFRISPAADTDHSLKSQQVSCFLLFVPYPFVPSLYL